MKLNTRIFALSILTISLAGCASSDESDPNYVSPAQYQGYNCKQIQAEMNLVSKKIEQGQGTANANQLLDSVVSAYAISQNSFYYNDGASGITRLRNQYDVLEHLSIQKECNLK